MKIYLSKINESWIVDRVREEWYLHNKNLSTEKIKEAEILWIIAPWVWKKIQSISVFVNKAYWMEKKRLKYLTRCENNLWVVKKLLF